MARKGFHEENGDVEADDSTPLVSARGKENGSENEARHGHDPGHQEEIGEVFHITKSSRVPAPSENDFIMLTYDLESEKPEGKKKRTTKKWKLVTESGFLGPQLILIISKDLTRDLLMFL